MTEVITSAYLWWCEDEVCDCTQYRIERRTPRPWPSVFYDVELLWKGQFWTDGTSGYGDHLPADNAERVRHFRKAARRFGVPLTRDEFGNWRGEVRRSAEPMQRAADQMDEVMG